MLSRREILLGGLMALASARDVIANTKLFSLSGSQPLQLGTGNNWPLAPLNPIWGVSDDGISGQSRTDRWLRLKKGYSAYYYGMFLRQDGGKKDGSNLLQRPIEYIVGKPGVHVSKPHQDFCALTPTASGCREVYKQVDKFETSIGLGEQRVILYTKPYNVESKTIYGRRMAYNDASDQGLVLDFFIPKFEEDILIEVGYGAEAHPAVSAWYTTEQTSVFVLAGQYYRDKEEFKYWFIVDEDEEFVSKYPFRAGDFKAEFCFANNAESSCPGWKK